MLTNYLYIMTKKMLTFIDSPTWQTCRLNIIKFSNDMYTRCHPFQLLDMFIWIKKYVFFCLGYYLLQEGKECSKIGS